MSTSITITVFCDNSNIRVLLDGATIINVTAGTKSKTVPLSSGKHTLDYFVQGNVGDKYQVTTSEPWDLGVKTMSGIHSQGTHTISIP